ncbi:hypothetical protein [Rhodococcus globerulus]|uniref:Uncharacterized protein n=1 Tax=Rhodococcus globerulus TaxID=33008 RepID=A0ABU4BRU7_RHOGO|nr:hypothetical protein [Rhodococcus globerulus]MDV6266941.1 hypothetical protein [Rhodococcus globerulus]
MRTFFVNGGQGVDRFPESVGSGAALAFVRQCGVPGTLRVQEILLRAAGARGVADFGGGEVFAGLGRYVGRSGGEASGPFYCPELFRLELFR